MLRHKYRLIKKIFTWFKQFPPIWVRLTTFAQMILDIDKNYRFSYLSNENGEIELLDALNALVPGELIFFDVGSHLGTYTDLVVERFENYQGHLFEISRPTYLKSVERLQPNERLTINHLGLSDSVGEVEYRHYPDDPTRNGISGVAAETRFRHELMKAPCSTGDQYCQQKGIKKIHLLKIDAEGYDLHVLKGFENMLKWQAIDVIQFEYNHRAGDMHVAMRDFYHYLNGHGYQLGPLRQQGVHFKSFEPEDNNYDKGPNHIACATPELIQKLNHF